MGCFRSSPSACQRQASRPIGGKIKLVANSSLSCFRRSFCLIAKWGISHIPRQRATQNQAPWYANRSAVSVEGKYKQELRVDILDGLTTYAIVDSHHYCEELPQPRGGLDKWQVNAYHGAATTAYRYLISKGLKLRDSCVQQSSMATFLGNVETGLESAEF